MSSNNKYKDAYEKLLDLHKRLYNDYADLIEKTMSQENCINSKDNEELVGLLRDAVSSTWGNPSLTETQVLFDKFLHDRKLAKPTLELVNSFLTDAVNRNIYDKKYSEKEVDTIMEKVFEAARKVNLLDGKNIIRSFTYKTLKHFLNGVKWEDIRNSLSPLPENKPKEQDTDTKGWEILSFKVATNPPYKYILTKNADGTFGHYESIEQDLLSSSVHVINSVKRLSDGEVFCIGDKVKYNTYTAQGIATINKFEISENNMIACGENIYIAEIKNIEPISKSPETLTPTPVTNNDDVDCLSVNNIMNYFRQYYEETKSMNPTHGEIRDYFIKLSRQKLNQ